MASQIANNMSDDDKSAIENMDMESMISHVTKNVFNMMNGGNGGETDGIAELMGSMGNIMGNFKKTDPPPQPQVQQARVLPKTRDISFDLNVDLVDFYSGKKKKINIKRKRIIEVDGKQKVVEEKKKIVIPIEKGMKDEQQIRFEGEADQIPGYTPGDIIITLIENEHPFFQRDNDNLIIIKNINLYQIYDYSFDITHLDSRVLRVTKNNTDALHLNDSLRKISGQGMPMYGSKNYGDLFIRFNLVIPKSLEPDKLNKLKEIFDEPQEPLAETFTNQFLLENVTDTDLEEFDESSSDSESESDTDESDDSGLSVSSASLDSEKEFRRRKR